MQKRNKNNWSIKQEGGQTPALIIFDIMADIFGIGSIIGAGISAGANYGITQMNNDEALYREKMARNENYLYNEQAANMADIRTRSLYTDLYSPQAQLEQLKAAGLSPSLFYGDGGGISGQAGAQGAGAGGIAPNVFGMTPIDFSQLGKIAAETEALKAQAANTRENTKNTELENEIKELENSKFKNAYYLSCAIFDNTSASEIADASKDFDEFKDKMREACRNSQDSAMQEYLNTEYGMQSLRDIYDANKRFKTELNVLRETSENATFQTAVLNALRGRGYAETNANTAIAKLKAEGVAASLTEQQKGAWDELLKKLDDIHPSLKYMAIMLGAIFGKTNFNLTGKSTTAEVTRK